ncbi:MAG: ABC transporter substrate-binding protein [Alphaproteobacteria bacterium]|nr:ABC transporter substrate-binding protein [Alphaproteobacteria bacterium]TAD90572.1 MAG: ABC transporter substrate-binding protein [Alphaproteobacteria bacterium]
MKRVLAAVVVAGLAAVAWPSAVGAQARDQLVLGMQLEPPHLDPTAGAAGAIREVTYANLFEGLTRLDRRGQVQPQLAERWTISPDGLSYRFSLRAGVRFHDGTPFDSASVKFTLERAMAPDSTNAQKQLFEPIASIETPDPLTVVITLKRPTASFLYNLAWGDAVMMAPGSVATNRERPIGTGPFRFDSRTPGDRVVLVKNPDHRDAATIALNRVVFRFISDPQAQVAALRAGDVDAFPNLGPAEAVDGFRRDARFTVAIGNTEGETILALNNSKAPFTDVRVRRAIAHAIDKGAVIDGAMSGTAKPIGSHFSPNHPAYVDLTSRYPYNPAEARRLLAEAGVRDLRVTLRLPPPAYARRSGEIIAAMLADVGITATIEAVEFPRWLETVFRNADFDMTIIAHTEPMDINIYGRPTYYFRYQNHARLQAIMDEVERTGDEAARNRLYGDAQRLLSEDAVNVFLFQLPKIGVWNARLEGLWENSPLQANDVTGVRWRN